MKCLLFTCVNKKKGCFCVQFNTLNQPQCRKHMNHAQSIKWLFCRLSAEICSGCSRDTFHWQKFFGIFVDPSQLLGVAAVEWGQGTRIGWWYCKSYVRRKFSSSKIHSGRAVVHSESSWGQTINIICNAHAGQWRDSSSSAKTTRFLLHRNTSNLIIKRGSKPDRKCIYYHSDASQMNGFWPILLFGSQNFRVYYGNNCYIYLVILFIV